jgi:heptosyltransferase-1
LNSFLIVRIGSLGDVVHAIPFAAALRNHFPHARIDWMVDPRYVELLDLVPIVDRRIPVDTRSMLRGGERTQLLRTLRQLRRVRYDVAFDLQGLLKSAVLARATGARRVAGFTKDHLREPIARLFYTEQIDAGGAAHVIDKNLALLDAAGVSDRRVRFPLRLPASPLVESIVARGVEGFVLINPGAAWPNKRWPAERFGAVAAAIDRQYGFRSFVLWGPGEELLAQAVANSSSGVAEVLPATTIAEIAGVARASRLMISGDTGPMHIAAAVGTPLVTLFGPTRPERNGPWAAHDIAISRVDRCACVYERTCRRDMPCINDILVQEVMDAVGRRLGATREAPGALR